MALAAFYVACPADLRADVRCDEHTATCTMDLDRARQCVTDAHELDGARLELDARLDDLRGLQRRHQALGLVLDQTAAALEAERARWSGWVWAVIGASAVLVVEAVVAVLALTL